MKIYIQDLVAQHNECAETELKPNDVIRFENGRVSYQFSFNEDGEVVCHKTDGFLSVRPHASNVISIK